MAKQTPHVPKALGCVSLLQHAAIIPDNRLCCLRSILRSYSTLCLLMEAHTNHHWSSTVGTQGVVKNW